MALNFNNRIKIYTTESYGPEAFEEQEVIIAKPWADIKTIKGNDFVMSGLEGSEIPVRFIIRYREGIELNHRVKWKNEEYKIESLQNDDGQNHTLTIYAKKYK